MSNPNNYVREDGRWMLFGRPMIADSDALPCPKCGAAGDDLEICANVVICVECGYRGPDHGVGEDGKNLPEFMCDWREAIFDWNNNPLRGRSEPWVCT